MVYPFCLYTLNLIKMQILLCIGKALAVSVSLATIGVCVFCAPASVGALFILYRRERDNVDYEQWLQRAKHTLENEIQPGKKFEVKSLFPGHEWEALSRGERTGFGSYFSTAVDEGRIDYVNKCENGKSRHNQYIKRG